MTFHEWVKQSPVMAATLTPRDLRLMELAWIGAKIDVHGDRVHAALNRKAA